MASKRMWGTIVAVDRCIAKPTIEEALFLLPATLGIARKRPRRSLGIEVARPTVSPGNSQIDLDGFGPAMTFSSAKALVASFGLQGEEYKMDSAFETVSRLVLPHAELHFFKGPEEPILMEFHFLTPQEIRRTKGDWVYPNPAS